jgi:hypothetical protein
LETIGTGKAHSIAKALHYGILIIFGFENKKYKEAT